MSSYSDIDLCFLFLDFGDSWLRTATTEMLRSAQRAMPGINIVQISDNKAKIHPFANASRVFDRAVDKSDLAAFKGYAFAQHAMETERPTIFCDVDLIWNNAGAAQFARAFYQPVACAFRGAMADTSLLVTTPGDAEFFWGAYQTMCDGLRSEPRTYGGDSFALAAMIGYRDRCRFALANASVEPTENPTVPLDSWAVHFAAHRDWLVPYARLLDGGGPFKELLPDFDEITGAPC